MITIKQKLINQIFESNILEIMHHHNMQKINQRSIIILNKYINQLSTMTQQEFDQLHDKNNIQEIIDRPNSLYVDHDFEIITKFQ